MGVGRKTSMGCGGSGRGRKTSMRCSRSGWRGRGCYPIMGCGRRDRRTGS